MMNMWVFGFGLASNEKRATGNEKRATGNEKRATSNDQRVKIIKVK